MIPEEYQPTGTLWSVGPRVRSDRSGVYVMARCECGTEREVLRSSILRGESRSCGCTRRTDPVERFWSYVERSSDASCWTWVGYRNTAGYGVFYEEWSKSIRAHRFAYELLRGPIPAGLVLDHLCRNRECVNPAHLEPVTNRENVLRGVSDSAANARKTHCKRGHEFTPENTWLDATRGSRRCRTCAALQKRRVRAGGAA